MIACLGIGIDIERTDRFINKNLKNTTFQQKIFTKKELDYCYSKKAYAQHLAARFAGKEAIIKALGEIQEKILPHRQIEILNDQQGVPHVSIEGYTVKITLSHNRNHAVAFALLEKTNRAMKKRDK